MEIKRRNFITFCTSLLLTSRAPKFLPLPDSKFLSPIPKRIKNLGDGTLRLNHSAEFILNSCNGVNNVFEIIDSYRKAFEISFEKAVNDCLNVLDYLISARIIKVS